MTKAAPPIVFVDRDGTLIEECRYLSSPERVRLLPGVARALRQLNERRIPVALVTNQSGLGRGFFTEEQYWAVHAELESQLARQGAHLDAHRYCADLPESHSPRRKPSPQMFREAAAALGCSTRGGLLIGDQLRDVLAAQLLGCHGWLVETGHLLESGDVPSFVSRAASLPAVITSVIGADG